MSEALPTFKSAKITGFEGPAVITERLQELGLHLGSTIHYLGRAPFHGPLLYRIGATVVALRESEALCLKMQAL